MQNDCGCGSSIISKQPSLIPSPLCAPTCPTDYGCWATLPSSCVFWNGGDIASIGIVNNNSLNQVITQLIINSGIGVSCCVPLVWQDITLAEGVTVAAGGYQTPQYSIDPANRKVYLRGTIDASVLSLGNEIIGTIPILPLYNRSFMNAWVNYSGGGLGIRPQRVGITTTGQILLLLSDSTSISRVFISFDGLSYETN